MKNYLFLCLCGFFCTANTFFVSAQVHSIHLAIVASDEESKTAADFLTAALSENDDLALLERNEIERIYREQSLSAANVDLVKMGELLGADGLMFLESTREGTNRFLRSQLVAVKPGVIVDSIRSVIPGKEISEWTRVAAKYFEPLYPKLRVLKKDAIPLSVINLRAAVQSTKQNEVERQLTLMLIARLSHERDIFVLERRRLGALTDEKNLKEVEESPFWNGSYLVEGTIDRNGYSQDKITLNLQLLPPGGAAPTNLEVIGPRDDLNMIVEELVQKILKTLQRTPVNLPWQSQAEAQNYFEEARWFLKWNLSSEAQAASEAAWALGKRDVEVATVRIKSYLSAIPTRYPRFASSGGGRFLSDARAEKSFREAKSNAEGLAIQRRDREVISVRFEKSPGKAELIPLRKALEFYLNFNQTLSPEEPRLNSPWLGVGLDSINAASIVLQQQYFFPISRQSYDEDVADVRLLTRKVAAVISGSPSVHASYWTGSRIATHDELAHSIEEGTNIFRLKAKFGCFWQETPEDCIEVYRDLMSSPVFAYVHSDVWLRSVERPRIVNWRSSDLTRVASVWQTFLGELESSTNFLLQAEAKAFKVADAESDSQRLIHFDDLASSIFTNAQAWVSHPVDLLYSSWGIGSLVQRNGTVTPEREQMQQKFYKEYLPRFRDMESNYWRHVEEMKSSVNGQTPFQMQKAWLLNNTPFEFFSFTKTFSFRQYTKQQAAELRPLLAAYSSNLTSSASSKSAREQHSVKSAQIHIAAVEQTLARILDPPATIPQSPVRTEQRVPQIHHPQSALQSSALARSREPVPAQQQSSQNSAPVKTSTNKLTVSRFVSFPVTGLVPYEVKSFTLSRPSLRAGKLLFDFWFSYETVYATPTQTSYQNRDQDGSAFFDPVNGRWEFFGQPKPPAQGSLGAASYRMERLVNSELHENALYSSFKNELRKYNLQARRWEFVPFVGEKQLRLFSVEGRLIGANEESIVEVLDGGKGNRLLASTRRRPAVSALDTLESLGSPVIFAGPTNSFRSDIQGKLYSWTGSDWSEIASVGHTRPAEVFAEKIILQRLSVGRATEIFEISSGQAVPELCWREEPVSPGQFGIRQSFGLPPNQFGRNSAKPLPAEARWNGQINIGPYSAVGADGDNLYFLKLSGMTYGNLRNQVSNNLELICLLHGEKEPVVIPLELTPIQGKQAAPVPPAIPFRRDNPSWMLFSDEALIFSIAPPSSPATSPPPVFWILPKSELRSAIMAEKNAR